MLNNSSFIAKHDQSVSLFLIKGYASGPWVIDLIFFCTIFLAVKKRLVTMNQCNILLIQKDNTGRMFCAPFFYKQYIFDPRPENCLSSCKKSPPKIV